MVLYFSMLAGHHVVPGIRFDIDPLYLGLVLSVSGIIVFIVILIFCCFYKPRVRPQLQVNNDGVPNPSCIGLDPSVIETFPIFKYSEVAAHKECTGPMECSVCLSPFEADEMLRLLPKCNHVFHVSCLDPWLKDHDTCPLCRVCPVPESGELMLVDVRGVDETGSAVGNQNALEVRSERDVEEGVFGKHKRWNSTGNVVVVDPVEMKSWERFTLRLPEEDLGKYGVKTGNFRRASSL